MWSVDLSFGFENCFSADSILYNIAVPKERHPKFHLAAMLKLGDILQEFFMWY